MRGGGEGRVRVVQKNDVVQKSCAQPNTHRRSHVGLSALFLCVCVCVCFERLKPAMTE